MSAYTVSEIVVWLSLTAVLGIVLGWLLHALVAGRRVSPRRRHGPAQESAVPQGESAGD